MPKHEVYDTMERGYSDSVTTTSTAASAAHSRSTSKPEKDLRAQSETYDHDPGRKGHERDGPLSLESVGRAVAARGMRAAKRGNLLFLIVFVTALFVFFGALAGIGYVDPDAQAPAPDSQFVMGQPVFDLAEGQRIREVQMAEQRALEQQWAKKKRPNAGDWMKKQRNDGAIRGGAASSEDISEDRDQSHFEGTSTEPESENEEENEEDRPHDHNDH